MHDIRTETVTLRVSDGSSMNAYVATPGSGNGLPGLLVFQEAFGVNAHIRDVTERLAKQGYVAIAPEMFHRTAPGFEAAYTDPSSYKPQLQALTPEGIAADATAAFEWLKANSSVRADSIASIGWCMGGRASFLANSVLPLKAAVSFYGGGIAPALLPRSFQQHGPVLFFWGGLDAHISQDQIRSTVDVMKEAKKIFVNVEFSDADHGFFCDARAAYNETAAKQAWELTLKFLTTYM